jgi:hypothetical protein
VVRTVRILEASNVDWEDITRDESFFYIADIGNNNGNRTNLRIYKVGLADMTDDSATAEIISFNYPDQTDFNSNPQNHNFDAEAVMSFGDSLYIFSKNWGNLRTKVYALPKEPGNYAASLLDDMFAGGLITGADINTADSVIMLIGYTKLLQPYIWLLWDFNGHDILGANKRKVNLDLPFHQTEGVAWWRDGDYLISNEDLSSAGVAAAVHLISTSDWITAVPTAVNISKSGKDVIEIFPNPVKSSVYISWKSVYGNRLEIINAQGKVVFSFPLLREQDSIQLEIKNLPAGLYNVLLHTKSKIYTDSLLFVPGH